MKKIMMSRGYHGQIEQAYDSYCGECRVLENQSVGVCLLSASQPTNLFTFAISLAFSKGVNAYFCSLLEDLLYCGLYKVKKGQKLDWMLKRT